MELNHDLAKSHFSTSQNGVFSFQWKIEELYNFCLPQGITISSPNFFYKDNRDTWFLKLKISNTYHQMLAELELYSNSNDDINIKFATTVAKNLEKPYNKRGFILSFSKLRHAVLFNQEIPRLSFYDALNITCTIEVLEIKVETVRIPQPNLNSSESQSIQQSSSNKIHNNSGKADRMKKETSSPYKRKKVDESTKKITGSVSERTKSSRPENTPDDSPDLKTLKQLSIDLKRMLSQAMNTDVAIRVEDITIKAHKNILCARSQVFCNMFVHYTFEAANSEIEVTDIRAPVMKKLINYLYCGEKGRLQYGEACELYYAADKYEISCLREACMKDLLCLLDVNNACPMLSLAYRHSDDVFKEQIKDFISKNFKSIVKTKSWIELTDKDTKLAALLMRYCAEALIK